MNKNVIDDEELQRIIRAAQAVRMGMNMHYNDTKPGPSWFSVFVKSFIWIIIALMVLGTQADKLEVYLNKWQ